MSLPPKENALFKRILVSGGAGGPGSAAGSGLRRPRLVPRAGGERSPGATGAGRGRRRPRPVPPGRSSAAFARRVPALAAAGHPALREMPRGRSIHRPPLQSRCPAEHPPWIRFIIWFFSSITHCFAVGNNHVCWSVRRWLSKEEVEKDEGFEVFSKFNLQLTPVEICQSILLGGGWHMDERTFSVI